jgi:hypothetical protein
MLTTDEFSLLARGIKELVDNFNTQRSITELLLEYTDLSSEDEEYLKELDEQLALKIETE